MPNYNRVTDAIIVKLQGIVGAKYVYTDEDKLEPYAHDELTGPNYVKMPEVVVLPASSQEIAQVITLANAENIPIIPRGAGTGLASAAVPFHGGIVLSTERMNKVLEVDEDNMVIVAEPGATTEIVQKAANAQGFLYAGDPCSGDSSSIGGNVATNAGGNKAIKYGTTRQQVLGLEVVTAQGEILTLGGKCRKDSTGYSLMQLFIGSEGTLGVITKVILKLVALPKNVMDLLAVFPDMDSAIGVVPKIMRAGINPVCVEFMDNKAIRSCEAFLREKLPHSDNGNYIIVSVEGDHEELLEDQCCTIDELCSNNGALTVLVADSVQIWKARKCFAEADRSLSLIFSTEDMVVPVSQIPIMVEKIVEFGTKHGITIHCAGHAGDGNIHADILKQDLSDEEWATRVPLLEKDIYETVYALGGKLSGEHGIGYKRVGLMEAFCNPLELSMMRSVKKALDPNLILNPGKIFTCE